VIPSEKFGLGSLHLSRRRFLYCIIYWSSAQVQREEGAPQIEDLVIWLVRSSSFSSRLYKRVSSGPIYSLGSFLEGLEAIFIEAEFLAFYSEEGALQIDDSTI
jgi:hypothetical protein